MQVVACETHRVHDALEIHNGELTRSSESPERADMIEQALRDAGHDFVLPDSLDTAVLNGVHSVEYTDFLSRVWERWEARGDSAPAAMGFVWPTRGLSANRPTDLIGELGYYSFAGDTTIVAGTWEASQAAAAIAMTAADLLHEHDSTVYGLCRPPGHHAMPDQFGGYCYLNNAAVAAQRLRDRGAERVAILDVDYHHGNGTQAIFEARSDVLVVSIHADPIHEFPWFSGYANETGTGSGEGWNRNLPLPPGSDFTRWSAALDVALARIEAASVDALVVSLGVDTYQHDPIGTFKLATDDFSRIASRVAALRLPTVLLQEGGYAVHDLGVNVAAFLAGFS